MKSRLATGSALLWTVGLFSLACSGDPDLVILQNQVPQTGCLITADRGTYRGQGVLDVRLIGQSSPVGYRLHPLVQNGYPAVGEANGREPNRVYFRGFRIRLTLAESASPEVTALFDKLTSEDSRLIEYEEPWSGAIEPGGLAATSVTAIPGDLARRIAATGALEKISHVSILVHAHVLGDRSQGSVTSGEFTYPVRICAGCLVSNLRACPYQPVNAGNACNIAQDEPVDCCTDGQTLRCPASSPQR